MSRRLFDTRPEHALVVLGLIFGLLSVGVTPPMQAPDETEHFYRAYQISEGTLIPLKMPQPRPGGATGGNLPRALAIVESFNPLRHQPDLKITAPVTLLQRLMTETIEVDQRRFFAFSNTAAYSPVVYVPQAAGIWLGRLFTRSPIVLAYLSRIANLLTWIVITTVAVRLAPIWKWSIVAIALTPMSLFLAASASADAFTNAISHCFVAQSLRLFVPSPASQPRREQSILLLLAFLMSLGKVPYQWMAIFPIGLMTDRFSLRSCSRSWRFSGLLLLVMAGGFVGWMAVVRNTFSPYLPNWDPAAQLQFVISHPAALCWGTFGYLQPAFAWRTATQFVGKLGWLDTMFPWWFYPLHVAALLLVAARQPSCLPTATRRRLGIVSVAVGLTTCWLVCFVVLLAGTGVGAYEMFVQGRYFLPVATMLMGAVSVATSRLAVVRSVPKVAAAAWAIYLPSSLILMIAVLRWRYYP